MAQVLRFEPPTPRHGNHRHGVVKPHPRCPDTIELYQFRRGASNPTWEARFKIFGTWTLPVSLATTDWNDALFVSIDKLRERETAAKTGTPVPGARKHPKLREQNTVAEIAVVTIARLLSEAAAIAATQPKEKTYTKTTRVNLIKRFILPGLGDRGIANLNGDDVAVFRDAVRVRGGQKPKKSTIAHLNSAWLEILRDAVALRLIKKSATRLLTISQSDFDKGERGAAFSRLEMRALREYMTDAWIDAGHTLVVRQNRFLCRALVSLMASTGLTPGLETTTLTAPQIEIRDDTNGRPSLRIFVREHAGKRAKSRVVWARVNDVWSVVSDVAALRAWVASETTADARTRNPRGFLFARPCDGRFPLWSPTFAEILTKLGLRVDPVTGVNRRLYSCRHYYATQSLLDGVPNGAIASNMGTSLRMIDEHYGHVVADMQSGLLTGSGSRGEWLWRNGTMQDERLRRLHDPLDDDRVGEPGYAE